MIENPFETFLGIDAWSQHSPGNQRFKKNVLPGTQKLEEKMKKTCKSLAFLVLQLELNPAF